MAKSRSYLWTIIIIAILIALGSAASRYSSSSTTQSPSSAIATISPSPFAIVSYEGVDGKNAFELLQTTHKVDSQQYDFGVMVKSIDGQASDSTKYWLYYINGQPATVGADKYITKSGDTIEWRLEPANNQE